jgi:hypothetical protein
LTRPRSLTVIASLAIAQGVVCLLVALIWLQIASIFVPESGITSSFVAMMGMARGWVLIALALMYFLFAAGAWQTKGWAWWVGLLVSLLSILIILNALVAGGSVEMALFWLIVPVVMLWYLLSPSGRQAITR